MTTCSNSDDYLQCQAQKPAFDPVMLLAVGEMFVGGALCIGGSVLVEE